MGLCSSAELDDFDDEVELDDSADIDAQKDRSKGWESRLIIPCRENVYAIFRSIAEEGEHEIPPERLVDAFQELQGIQSGEEMQEILLFIDADGNGVIDENEFFQLAYVAANLPSKADAQTRALRIQFLAGDTDLSGTMEFDELARLVANVVLRALQDTFTLQELIEKSRQLLQLIRECASEKQIEDHLSFSGFCYFWNLLLGGGPENLENSLRERSLTQPREGDGVVAQQ